MEPERLTSAYRLGLAITLIYVLWLILPQAIGFTRFVVSSAPRSEAPTAAPRSQTPNAPGNKLSATGLESALLQSKRFGPAPQLHCESGAQAWDYLCSYLPAPKQSTTRLQFGVNVDAKRWVKVSGIVPVGTAPPPPQ